MLLIYSHRKGVCGVFSQGELCGILSEKEHESMRGLFSQGGCFGIYSHRDSSITTICFPF